MSRINSLLEFFFICFPSKFQLVMQPMWCWNFFFPVLYWYDFPKSEQQTQWICDAYTLNKIAQLNFHRCAANVRVVVVWMICSMNRCLISLESNLIQTHVFISTIKCTHVLHFAHYYSHILYKIVCGHK